MITRDHVVWSYRVLLGREPENESVVSDKLNRLSTVEDLRMEVVASSEFSSSECQKRRQALPVTGEHLAWARNLILEKPFDDQLKEPFADLNSLVRACFRLLRPSRGETSVRLAEGDEILLLGNCQTDLLTSILAHGSGCPVENVRENVLCDSRFHEDILEKARKYRVVITQPLFHDRFGPLQTTRLREKARHLLVIPAVYFSGLQPDLIYLGSMDNRYLSPIGEYHSAIGVAAYLEKFSPEQTMRIFRDPDIFAKAGFLGEWEESLNELKGRETFCDISISRELIQNLTRRPLFYSPNHPSLEVINWLARKILRQLDCDPGWISFWRDEMQANIIYPVWRPLAEYHRLAFRSPEMFFVPQSAGGRMDVAAYLAKAFRRYRFSLPKEAVSHTKVERIRAVL